MRILYLRGNKESKFGIKRNHRIPKLYEITSSFPEILSQQNIFNGRIEITLKILQQKRIPISYAPFKLFQTLGIQLFIHFESINHLHFFDPLISL